MKIMYYPVENRMAAGTFRAQVTGFRSVTEKEIIEYATRAGSTITPAEARANYEEFIGAYEYFLRQGYGINTEFINIRPAIRGTFSNTEEKFDSSRHKVKFKVSLGRRYNKTSNNVKTEKVEAANNLPFPVSVEDITSGTFNEQVSPDGVVSLSGKRLLFRQDDPQQGIFLLDATGKANRVEKILSHKGSQVIFIVPAGLAAGDYTLQVRMTPRGNKITKTGILPDQLTVEA